MTFKKLITLLKGKDECDRMAAVFKGHAQRWLIEDETNKISTAKDLIFAVFANGGPPNTKMCVARIKKETQIFKDFHMIPNISKMHSISFTTENVLYKEYFGIGDGKPYQHNGE